MTRYLTTSSLVLILILAASLASTAYTQSGRRQPKRPAAAPIPTPTPEPTPEPKNEERTDLAFLVGIDKNEAFTYYPLSFYSAVLGGCSEQLRRASSAKVTTAHHLSRGDAIKKAKADKTTYVVWLRLATFSMGRSPSGNLDDIEIEYVVFAPVTGKIATSGRSYQNATRTGPVVVQPPGGGGNIYYREYLLKRAAEDAADRILRALHIMVPKLNAAKRFQSQHKAAQ